MPPPPGGSLHHAQENTAIGVGQQDLGVDASRYERIMGKKRINTKARDLTNIPEKDSGVTDSNNKILIKWLKDAKMIQKANA